MTAELASYRKIVVLTGAGIFDDAHDAYGECHAGTADELVPRLFA